MNGKEDGFNPEISKLPAFQRLEALNYSTFKITGSINCVFTGIPLFIAGFIFGNPTKRAFKILSIFTMS